MRDEKHWGCSEVVHLAGRQLGARWVRNGSGFVEREVLMKILDTRKKFCSL